MKRLMFIVNPMAGRSVIKDNLMDVVQIFAEKEYNVTLYITQKKRDATRFVQEDGAAYDLIVCAGGDGTLNEVVNGLLTGGIQRPLGYIPTGTTNDFAISHDLSKFPRQAARNIVKGTPRVHDVGIFNGRYFTYVAAFGLFADVSFSTPQALKNLLGRFAYYFEGAKKIPALTQDYAIHLDIDGVMIHDRFCFLAVCNSLSIGGVLQFSERSVSLSDGMLEVLAIRPPQNPIEFQRLMRSLHEKDYNNNIIRCLQGKKVRVTSEEGMSWTLDGENGGVHKEVHVDVLPQQLTFIY